MKNMGALGEDGRVGEKKPQILMTSVYPKSKDIPSVIQQHENMF